MLLVRGPLPHKRNAHTTAGWGVPGLPSWEGWGMTGWPARSERLLGGAPAGKAGARASGAGTVRTLLSNLKAML